MSGWHDILFQRIGEAGGSGFTKSQLYGYVSRRAPVSREGFYTYLDSLCGWGILEKHASGKAGVEYRLKRAGGGETVRVRASEARPKREGDKSGSISVARVFGHKVSPEKIRDAAAEACRKRVYGVEDMHVSNFIRGEEWDNLMVKIALLDHIEEQLTLMYPDYTVFRKNKITLEVQPP